MKSHRPLRYAYVEDDEGRLIGHAFHLLESRAQAMANEQADRARAKRRRDEEKTKSIRERETATLPEGGVDLF